VKYKKTVGHQRPGKCRFWESHQDISHMLALLEERIESVSTAEQIPDDAAEQYTVGY